MYLNNGWPALLNVHLLMHKIKTDNKEFTLNYKGKNICEKCPWSCNEAKNFYPLKIIKCTGYDNILIDQNKGVNDYE